MKLRVFYDESTYRLKSSKKILKLIEKVIRNENKVPGDLNFIFTTDKELIKINKEFLKHNYFTDVVAFENNNGKIINGEVYLSIDTVKRNANNYKVSLKEEVIRVMIHGTLHLCDYKDKKKAEKEEITKIENKWLKKIRK
ncbi:MAG: rRNA maturation RNase YbeY [Bacteroidia bacterium]|nr:rRNA maturation RNase YbeY [Bacteroidia bacterium]